MRRGYGLARGRIDKLAFHMQNWLQNSCTTMSPFPESEHNFLSLDHKCSQSPFQRIYRSENDCGKFCLVDPTGPHVGGLNLIYEIDREYSWIRPDFLDYRTFSFPINNLLKIIQEFLLLNFQDYCHRITKLIFKVIFKT